MYNYRKVNDLTEVKQTIDLQIAHIPNITPKIIAAAITAAVTNTPAMMAHTLGVQALAGLGCLCQWIQIIERAPV